MAVNKLFDPIDPLKKHYKDIKQNHGNYNLTSVCKYFKVEINVGRGNHEANFKFSINFNFH